MKNLFSILLLSAVLAGCGGSYVSSIPSYPVSLHLNLTASYSAFKNSFGEFLEIKERIYETDRIGFGGILLCSGEPDSYGNSQYFAYDLACPVEAKRDVRVKPVTDNFCTVRCEKCGAEYYVGGGFGLPSKGNAKEPLKRYNTSLAGDILSVFPR